MNTSGSIVLKTLSILLGLFFIFIGVIKLSCFLSKDLHRDVRKEFVKYAKVFPLVQTLGFKIPAKWYRRVIGTLEVTCGIILVFIPKAMLKQIANVTLLILMSLNVYSHYVLSDKFERTAPSLVFTFMLIGRLVIEWQNRKQPVEMNGDIKNAKQD